MFKVQESLLESLFDATDTSILRDIFKDKKSRKYRLKMLADTLSDTRLCPSRRSIEIPMKAQGVNLFLSISVAGLK